MKQCYVFEHKPKITTHYLQIPLLIKYQTIKSPSSFSNMFTLFGKYSSMMALQEADILISLMDSPSSIAECILCLVRMHNSVFFKASHGFCNCSCNLLYHVNIYMLRTVLNISKNIYKNTKRRGGKLMNENHAN